MGHLLVVRWLLTSRRQQCLGARPLGPLQVVVLVRHLELFIPRQELVTQPVTEAESVVVVLRAAVKTRIQDLATTLYPLAGRTLVTTAAQKLDAGQIIRMPTTAAEKSAAVATMGPESSAGAARALLTKNHAIGGVILRKALLEICGLAVKTETSVTSARSVA